jgi:hypothetical protein
MPHLLGQLIELPLRRFAVLRALPNLPASRFLPDRRKTTPTTVKRSRPTSKGVQPSIRHRTPSAPASGKPVRPATVPGWDAPIVQLGCDFPQRHRAPLARAPSVSLAVHGLRHGTETAVGCFAHAADVSPSALSRRPSPQPRNGGKSGSRKPIS